MKGDFNDQPDISKQLGTTIINRNISFIQDSNDFVEEFSIELLVSYYKASDVVLGKVIFKVPAIGWIFLIPFFSPLKLFLILYLLITIIMGGTAIILMVHRANKKFRHILSSISNNITVTTIDKKIPSSSLFNFVFIPILLFANILIFSSVQANYTAEIIVLEDNLESNLNSTKFIKWNETIILKAGSKSYTNISSISMFILDSSNDTYLDLNFVEISRSKGSNIEDDLFGSSKDFEVVLDFNYDIKVKNSTFEIIDVIGNINPSRSLKGHHTFFITSVPNSANNPHSGTFVRDFYRKTNSIMYNSQIAWESVYEFTGTQELINFDVRENLIISNQGFLLKYSYKQSESLILIPEILYSLIPIIIFVPTIKLLQRKLQNEMNQRISLFVDSQKKDSDDLQLKVSNENISFENDNIENKYD
ncbi:MAG: hypothetical protein HeimC3_38850 [Candidatus Heimdallarchaeota archaeon LC_3]|nr:MAG: hypothetical protein HeimC3_38850 [Candidatus Heimdallarchaeota archaeon LC_3]